VLTPDRRTVLRCSVAAIAGVALAPVAPAAAAPAATGLEGLGVRPRADWAAPAPRGSLVAEPDVRFLLVHHTATPNDYTEDDVPDLLRGFSRFHTGAEKGWPDIAYNFFVDRFGGLWEGREGSLAGPVRTDATGGNQGYAQLCCFLGDHTSTPPTEAATTAMTRLLAGLADRHGVDTAPGATASFVSRGSNRWPAGRSVTVGTIAGHRDVSRTTCPGDAAYALLETELPTAVSAVRRVAGSVTSGPPTSAAPASAPAAPAPTPPATSPAASSVADVVGPAAVATGLAGLVATGVLALRRRRGDDRDPR
jgi:hypothetical protein